MLLAWLLLPLLVFCLARSRLPLYILPLFLPLAVIVARQRGAERRALSWRPLLAWGGSPAGPEVRGVAVADAQGRLCVGRCDQ
jgi:4-amino-4-deoxy-L-arabinose transferase-like glycosyltransferase